MRFQERCGSGSPFPAGAGDGRGGGPGTLDFTACTPDLLLFLF